VITTDQERAEWSKHETEEIRQARLDLATIASSPGGKRAIYRILENCGVGLQPADPYRFATATGEHDTHATVYELGRASVAHGLIKDMLETCPEAYELMLSEQFSIHIRKQKEEAKKDRKRTSTEETDDEME
jgi:hypothetical protein